jgi:Tol biopolymer transport system component
MAILRYPLLLLLAFAAQEVKASDPVRWTNISVKQLETDINSPKIEVVSCFSPDGDTLFFSTKRNTGLDQLWFCHYDGGKFHTPQRMSRLRGRAIGAITIDKQGVAYVAVQSQNVTYVNDINICTIDREDGSVWKLEGDLNTPGWESQPYVTRDGNTLYLATSRTGIKDSFDVDIYRSRKQGSAWSEAVPVGGDINTEAYEGFPTLSNDGKYLFYMRRSPDKSWSKLFYAELIGDEWTNSKPLPAPINTGAEMTIAFHPTENMFVIASKRLGAESDYDLFVVTYDVTP